MAKDKNKAFTIVELIVAMALLVMLVGLSSVVFSTTVKSHRTAMATIEITRKLNAITTQLNNDFRGLRRDGEILLVWVARPECDENNVVVDEDGNGIPDGYVKYDRIVFFTDGDFQAYRPQATTTVGVTKQVTGNLARVSYMLAKNTDGTQAELITPWRKRILARTQHIITADATLPLFPDPLALDPGTWDPAVFETDNFRDYEYQTMSIADWTNMSDPASPYFAAKNNILTILTDVLSILAVDNTVTEGGPAVETGDLDTYHNYFSEGVGCFGIQIWQENQQRWFPQIDPDGDGDYTDTDYPLDGSVISETVVYGRHYTGDQSAFSAMFGKALKFTFTLYDSKGIFPNGKTFTHIVYLDN